MLCLKDLVEDGPGNKRKDSDQHADRTIARTQTYAQSIVHKLVPVLVAGAFRAEDGVPQPRLLA